ncbi:MAG TPA: sugar transferase [Nocardioidaceae bacterium]|nr:sugar transferase [Nocardioidaceae bacterium]
MQGALDRIVAAIALLGLAPVLAAIAVVVKVGSPGPVIFKQWRAGLDGKPFQILKFRTMVVGAEGLAANISPQGDVRVTRAGRFLRAWYLDELPQLVNVVRGDMRLVGPRPETPEFVAKYDDHERQVLDIKPGLVGASTLAFMDEAECLAATSDPLAHYEQVLLHERVRLDLDYQSRRTFGTDIGLLARQALLILRH